MGLLAIGVLEGANEATGGGLTARGWIVMGWLEALPRWLKLLVAQKPGFENCMALGLKMPCG
jgi:hypothetical protein